MDNLKIELQVFHPNSCIIVEPLCRLCEPLNYEMVPHSGNVVYYASIMLDGVSCLLMPSAPSSQ